MAERSYFLIVSNMRTGSTWLETLLGSLPDVYADYEFKKVLPGYQTQEDHVPIRNGDFSAKRVLDGLSSSHPVVGSKLVFDIRPHAIDEYEILLQALDRDIHIIHLHRSYEEVVVSYAKGVRHMPGTRTYEGTVLGAQLSKPVGRERIAGKIKFAPGILENLLVSLTASDVWMASLSSRYPYLAVDYANIKNSMGHLARFIGSSASPEDIAWSVENPVVSKVTRQRPEEVVVNYSSFNSVCSVFEGIKNVSLL